MSSSCCGAGMAAGAGRSGAGMAAGAGRSGAGMAAGAGKGGGRVTSVSLQGRAGQKRDCNNYWDLGSSGGGEQCLPVWLHPTGISGGPGGESNGALDTTSSFGRGRRQLTSSSLGWRRRGERAEGRLGCQQERQWSVGVRG